MQEFVLSPPVAVIYLAVGVVVVGVLSVLLKKGNRARKVIGVSIVAAVAAVIVVVFYRPVLITVGPDGVSVASLSPVTIPWSGVVNAYYEPNLQASPFRPTVRTGGIAIGSFRSGRFLLSNGEAARVFMERSDAAVILRTADLTWLFAPRDVEGLARAVAEYRTVADDSANPGER